MILNTIAEFKIILSNLENYRKKLNHFQKMSISISESSSSTTVSYKKPIAIIFHPVCTLHDIPQHPECPGRIQSILTALQKEYPKNIFFEAPLVTDEQILNFHTKSHLVKFLNSCNAVKSGNEFENIDGDTVVMKHTKEAAYRAAGAMIAAIDKVFQNEVNSVFCAVRPPGHHATRSTMMGFCFINNVGIGAQYARQKYGINKVAVLDFDVHHGNGTEEGFTPFDYLFFGSTHEKDNYPGTGKEPLFINENSKNEIDRRIVNRYLDPFKIKKKENSVREEFKLKWQQIINEMIRFQPEFIIISAGFDAHDDDPLAWCDLLEEDFVWATERVFQACIKINKNNPPRVVSSLEGGYDLKALARSVVAHVKALEKGYPEEYYPDSYTEGYSETNINTFPSKYPIDMSSRSTSSNIITASEIITSDQLFTDSLEEVTKKLETAVLNEVNTKK